MMKLLLKKYYPNFLLLFAIIVIIVAMLFQYMFGILPCRMCYYQRIPYYIIIILGLINILVKRDGYRELYMYSCLILFVLNSVLSFYHMGIEYGYFNNIFNCVSEKNNYHSIAELKSSLVGTINVPCEVVGFKFILSLSGWNFFISLLLGFFTFYYILIVRGALFCKLK